LSSAKQGENTTQQLQEDVMDYPANIDVQTPETFDRWRPIGQPVLAIPHLIISAAFNSLSGSIAVSPIAIRPTRRTEGLQLAAWRVAIGQR
jgi:hypothetical protein